MSYKSFEDFYREAEIKHLLFFENNNTLISPPFCTDNCKEYSNVLTYDQGSVSTILVDTQPATSKYNSMAVVGDSLWFAPYGIWDHFNTVLEIKNGIPRSHTIDSTAKGQFYNLASNGTSAFAAPLGYEEVSFGLLIKNGQVKQIPFPVTGELKKHMGTVWCNGHYWSPPRGEGYDYNQILKFNPDTEELHFIEVDLPKARRKYSDFIVAGNKLFALPLGRDLELCHMLIVDTDTDCVELVKLQVPDFVKKYNAGVLLGDVIIAMPYGHKEDGTANHGLIFNTVTYEHTTFDISQSFGGKYRFRTGIEFNGNAVFFPAGSPNVKLIAVDTAGNIVFDRLFQDYVLGRPVKYNNTLITIAYHVLSKQHYVLSMDADFQFEFTKLC